METTKVLSGTWVGAMLAALLTPAALEAQPCVHAYDVYGAPASGLALVDMPPVRIVHGVVPGSPPSPALLSVQDCDGDGDLDVYVPWSDVGIPKPAAILFAPACAGAQPTHVGISFCQGVANVSWTAFRPGSGTPVAVKTTSGSGPHSVYFNHPDGIERVEIAGAEICIQQVCFGCRRVFTRPGGVSFRRGDTNGDDGMDIGDAVFLLSHLFQEGEAPGCLDAADVNDDGALDLGDPIRLLGHLFAADTLPPSSLGCQPDTTPDDLDCRNPGACAQGDLPSVEEEAKIFEAKRVPPQVDLPETPTSLTLDLSARGFRTLGSEGALSIREERAAGEEADLTSIGSPGQPDIARRMVNVILPYDADFSTIKIKVGKLERTPVPGGPFHIRPIRPMARFDPEGERVKPEKPAGVDLDADGCDPAVYGKDAFWPESPIEVAGFGAMRQHRYVRLLFSPYQWNPRTGDLIEVGIGDATVTWKRAPVDPDAARIHLSDRAVARCAPEIYLNLMSAQEWNELDEGFEEEGSYRYVIITTRAVERDSTELSNFVAHKESQGLTVAVVSVEAIEYAYPASERADSMRAFLRDKYAEWGIDYVLLIGDPDPYDQYVGASDTVGSVPMKMAWPRGDGLIGYDDGDPDYGYCPTDHYYGDLSGDWDVDGDGYAASDDDYELEIVEIDLGYTVIEWPVVVWGFDFDMEVRVGRIPFDDDDRIDAALGRIIRYQENSSDPSSARSRAFLACSFLDSETDSAYVGRQIHNDILDPNGMTARTFYQAASSFSSTHELTGDALPDEWSSAAAGLVLWVGHGNSQRTRVGYEDHWDGYLIHADDAAGLNSAPSAYVFQASCSNATPEDSDNIAHTMLAEAVQATVAGTRSSYYTQGQTDFGSEDSIGDLAYRYIKWLVKGNSAGESLSRMRSACSPDRGTRRQNLMTYNLYGDPRGGFRY
ncbi:MAG: hypothetical protein JXP34_02645 [Planctomycetes bacterium]|nr:hypothetical protein [Planctomycetota bacterium]